jgi:hypothetical protein
MNSHTSPCDHMILFVAKSSRERTRVPKRVIGRLTVRRLVNINPGRPRTSSTVAPRKPQQHHLRSLKSESKSFFFFLKHTHGIVKRAIQEAWEGGGAAIPARRAREGGTAPARRAREGEAAPALGDAAAPPAEVKPPPSEEVKPPPSKEVKPP